MVMVMDMVMVMVMVIITVMSMMNISSTQVYRNPGRVAPYTNYSGESIDLDLFDDDELGHPGDQS